MTDILVIGYGNDLRGDDGLGPFVAASLAAANLPGVQVRLVRQLVPELAAELATARRVVFVDALAGGGEVGVLLLEVAEKVDWCAHRADPRSLLALTQAVYGRAPEAWWVTAPGCCFEVGEGLSPFAQENARTAIHWVHALIGTESASLKRVCIS